MSMRYAFEADIWVYQGQGAWHFVTVPQALTAGIKVVRGPRSRGWGSLRVQAQIGASIWRTSIFPDTGRDAFLLPIKAEVRAREKLSGGERVSVSLEVLI